MARVAKRLFGPVATPAAATTEYTAPTGGKAIIRHIHIFNPTNVQQTITLSHGADAAGTRYWDAFPIAAGPGEWNEYGYIVVESAETVQLKGSSTSVIVEAYGDELTAG